VIHLRLAPISIDRALDRTLRASTEHTLSIFAGHLVLPAMSEHRIAFLLFFVFLINADASAHICS